MKKLSIFFIALFVFSCSNNEEDNNTPNVSIPELTTEGMSYITYTTAETGGYIFSDAGFQITSRGVVWSTSQNPTISLTTKTINGVGVGGFNSSISGLSPNTTYYVRAYATNSEGTGYGNQVTFTTLANQIPTVATGAIFNRTTTTATCGGDIQHDGGSNITVRGVVWSSIQNPTISLPTKTIDGSGVGGFQSIITGLLPGSTYYYRAYATNNVGTAYGNEITFTTQSILESMYPVGTVFCNNVVTAIVDVTNPTTGKTWMDRNLGASQVATSSSDALAYGDLYQWGRRADGHQCRNSATTTTLHSGDRPQHNKFITPQQQPFDWTSPQINNLWQGVNGINNPCPSGYRVPTGAELNAEKQSWSSPGNSNNAFNSNLKLPTPSYRYYSGNLQNYVGHSAHYWSSTPVTIITGSNMQSSILLISSTGSGINSDERASGLSIRCIKN